MSTSALPVAASPMPGEAMLRVEGLGFRYEAGRPAALEGVSFEIMAGTITAILGPNGAGKTTLLHVLLGLRKAASGQIWLAGRSLGAYTRRELSQWMGLVPQSEYLPFDYSVLEYVVLGRAPYLGLLDLPGEEDARVAREALATVGVDGLAARPIPELSGGELQLVLIARALAQQPRVLLLDEPSSHLDLSNRNATLRVMKQLRRAGTTILFSTHDPDAAALAADNLVLMKQGRILHAGPVAETFTSEKLSETYGMRIEVLRSDGMYLVRAAEGLQEPIQSSV